METVPIYQLRVGEVYRSLETSPNGLNQEEIEDRLSLYGRNLLSQPVQQPIWKKFVTHTIHPMALLLWFAGLIAVFVHQPIMGVVIWGVVILNATFSFWREHRAEQAITTLHLLLPIYARVIRGGMENSIPASEVAPGDVLVLAEGDNIPADARIVEEFGLRTNNSTLTGEAVPARKTADASFRDGISELERPNLVFAGTSIVSGTGRAVVYATGMLTQFGRIAHLTQEVKEELSPLQQELNRITRALSIAAISLGASVFLVGHSNLDMGPLEAFLLAIGTIVAVLPEGLPTTLTLSLAAAGQRLATLGVLVKKLSTIETLGTISIIATDKSGTLTQNQMTVREVWMAGQRFSVSGAGYEPKGEFTPEPDSPELQSDLFRLLSAGALSNNARVIPPSREKPNWSSLGDQTEAALKVAAFKAGLDEEILANQFPRLHEIPFDARRKRMSTIHLQKNQFGNHSGQEIAFVKGAPREVLAICNYILLNGRTVPLDDNLRGQILTTNDEFSRNALRVLALAQRELPRRGAGGAILGSSYSVERIEQDLTFLGLMAMMDPPRPEVAKAVKTLHRAGIRIVMITGDYGLTAESLARRVGLLTEPNPTIITGAELDQLNDLELQELIKQNAIYARMAPENKLRLVAAFQAQGHIVAVTGDGVNDAPALRKADVGISMGIIGTDVAKEAADVILTNDDFAAIAQAIAEGRTIFSNIRKFITYIFSSNVPEILPFAVTASSLIPFVWSVWQILAIDLGTDQFPALALGTEKPEQSIMHQPPRSRSKALIDTSLLLRAFLWLGLIEAALCYTGYIAVFVLSGNPELLGITFLENLHIPSIIDIPVEQISLVAATVFFAGIITAQVGNAFASRTERGRGRWLGWFSNRSLLVGVAIELAIGLLLIYSPINRIFGLVPLPAIYWVWLAPYALILYSLDWTRKIFIRRLQVVDENT